MMHYDNIVVSICDQKRKSLREYDAQKLENGRRSTVHIPFDTEYQILVKNNQNKKIRLDIDIDGANVSNDGFLINPWYTCYLERFLNSDRKFKFVPVNHEGVSDPSSNENGIITVVAHFEKQPEYVMPRNQPMNNLRRFNNTVARGSSGDTQWMNSQTICYSSNTIQTKSIEPEFCNFDVANTVLYDRGEAGATVEGSKSNQEFVKAYWNGDDPLVLPVTFKFKLLGMNNQDSKEWQEYQRLKEKFNAA